MTNCGLPIADCGFTSAPRTPNPQSAIRNPKSTHNPQSAIRNPKSRRAISLTEVLISMGILTLGLLGVAAVFPVGGWYMIKADIHDRGSAIAQAVMSDLQAKGMLNPRAWFVLVPSPPNLQQPNNPNYYFGTIDGKYAPVPVKPARPADVASTFTRPYAEALSQAVVQTTNPVVTSRQFGNAIVIDPLGVSRMAFPGNMGQRDWNAGAAFFPATAYKNYQITSELYSAHWQPWGFSWPVRRATFQQSNGWQMNYTIAEHYARVSDDLATELPQRDDRPAHQTWDTTTVAGNQVPLARQWTGDYSWIATVVPTTNAARDAMATNPEAHSYDVSVVVFYKRPLPDDATSVLQGLSSSPIGARDRFLDTMGAGERIVQTKIVSTGLNGGELLLTELRNDNPTRKAIDELRAGEWIMLCGPHPNSTVNNSTNPPTGDPRFVLNWYQVISIDSRGTGIQNFDPQAQRVIAVRGPEWPWRPATRLNDAAHLSNNLCVTICRGAVAVHTKTMRLESPTGGAWGGGMNIVVPPTVTPPWYR